MITEYTPVSWSPGEPFSIDKMNTMVQNVQLLYEKTPRVLYQADGIVKDKGVRVFATNVVMPKSTTHLSSATVYFGNFFSVGCRPMVALGYAATPQARMHLTFVSLGGSSAIDHRGMVIRAASDEVAINYKPIGNAFHVNVIAVGW